jgi:hypothetical protein
MSIDKTEQCLEHEGCIGINMVRLVVILLLYVDDIVLLAKPIEDLHKQLKCSPTIIKNYELTINMIKLRL